MTKPFVLLQSRPEDEASDNEYQAFLHFGGLAPSDLERVRIEAGQRPAQSLAAYSGVLMGGGPANFAYALAEKPAEQRQFEAVMMPLLREIITHDIPFLGACLGVGALVSALGGTPSFAYGEAIGAVPITLTPAAADDPLLADLPTTFDGFVGHKEGVLEPPAACTVLARSHTCVQMLRVGRNVYATQSIRARPREASLCASISTATLATVLRTKPRCTHCQCPPANRHRTSQDPAPVCAAVSAVDLTLSFFISCIQ